MPVFLHIAERTESDATADDAQMSEATMKKLASLIVVMLYLLLSGAALAHEGHNDAFSEGHSEGDAPVEVDAQGVQALGIRTGAAGAGSIKNILKATGEVTAAETNAFEVNAPASGTVRAVYAKHGDSVKKGQILATIHSMEVADHLTELIAERNKIQADIDRAKMQYQSEITLQQKEVELTELEYKRQQALLEEKIAALKTFQQAKNDYEKAKVKLSSLRSRQEQEVHLLRKQLAATVKNMKGQLIIMGISTAAVDRALAGAGVTADLAITAPVSGVVTMREVSLGERVEPGKKIFSVVNLNPIWVMVDIFQEQIPNIKLGQQVQLKTPSDQVVTGTISSIDSIVDPVKKTLHVRIVADNRLAVLRPGMFVTAEIVLGNVVSNNVVLPSGAIVDSANKHIVYKKSGDKYTPVEVVLGQQASGRVEVIQGVSPGDVVVTEGARQLLAQGMIGAEAEEHEGPGHDEHGAHEHHEAAMEPETKPEVLMVMTFVGGLLTAVLAYLAVRYSRRKKVVVRKVEEKAKVDA